MKRLGVQPEADRKSPAKEGCSALSPAGFDYQGTAGRPEWDANAQWTEWGTPTTPGLFKGRARAKAIPKLVIRLPIYSFECGDRGCFSSSVCMDHHHLFLPTID